MSTTSIHIVGESWKPADGVGLFKVDAELATFSKKLWWDFLTIPGGKVWGSPFGIVELL